MFRWTTPFCAELVALGYRVVRFDNRDAGYSTHLDSHPAVDFGALAAALQVDALGIGRAYIAGQSMGGMIAQIMAGEHKDRALSRTSIMSSTRNPALPQAAPDAMAMMIQPMPDPSADRPGFLSRSSAFARRITGTGYAFDEGAHHALVLEELDRGYDPAGQTVR